MVMEVYKVEVVAIRDNLAEWVFYLGFLMW